MLGYAIAFALTLLLSLALTPLARKLAFRLNTVHYPKAISIDTHVNPIPYLGGLPIFTAFIASTTLIYGYLGDLVMVIPALIAMTIVAIGGFIDDAHPLSVLGKFIAQIVATTFILVTGQDFLQILPIFGSTVPDTILAFIFLVGLMNAINFLDIMDGLAAGVVAIASLGFAGVAILQNQPIVAVMALALAGSTIGFLYYNFNPARIFMGDTGSQFIGFTLALFPPMLLKQNTAGSNQVLLVASLIILTIPLFEMTYTSTIRILTGKRPWKGSKDHFALRAFAMGYSVRKIVLTTYAIGIVVGIAGIIVSNLSIGFAIGVAIVVLACSLVVARWLSRVHVPKPAAGSQNPVKPTS